MENQSANNTVFTITNNGKFDVGYLHQYDSHLYDIMTFGASYVKQYCNNLKDGLMVGYNPEIGCGNFDDANENRQLFHIFLLMFRGGKFKYRKSSQSKWAYFEELPKQPQRNINRVIDTLNDIYKIG